MITSKNIGMKKMITWSFIHIVWLLAFMGIVALMYKNEIIKVAIPWFPLSVIGTAVSFYVGFKNNQAYDRMWEARKIWGSIVNQSRSLGMQIDNFISNLYTKDFKTASELHLIKQRMIYRHIGWLYTHRNQLLELQEWEHANQKGHIEKYTRSLQQRFGLGLVLNEILEIKINHYLSEEELQRIEKAHNPATQLINEQARELAKLREEQLIDDFRHMEMSKTLTDLFDSQGKNERIKKFPFPRQYANLSRYFIAIFIALLPFSMIPELMKMSNFAFYLSIPITALIGWIYVVMEIVGDYSENPFEGMANDIPMLSLCRNIEIDLLEMLGETHIPAPIRTKESVLL